MELHQGVPGSSSNDLAEEPPSGLISINVINIVQKQVNLCGTKCKLQFISYARLLLLVHTFINQSINLDF